MITFKTIRIKNFLSFGNVPTELRLDQHQRTLIMGENGSGKSSIAQALCYGLFNKTYRKVNLPQLINSINEKECLVEIEFSIHHQDFLVRRGQKPNIFEIYQNGKLLSNDKDFQRTFEETILKTDFNTFSSVVVIGGRNYTTFMNLKRADRRKIIESLLDIDVFSLMNVVAKLMIVETNTLLRDQKVLESSLHSEVEILEKIVKDAQEGLEETNKQHQEKISRLMGSLQEIECSLETLIEEEQTLLKEIGDVSYYILQFNQKYNELSLILNKRNSSLSSLFKKLKFYEENISCPTCFQEIPDSLRIKECEKIKDDISKKELYFKEKENHLYETKIHLDELNQSKEHLLLLQRKQSELKNERNKIKTVLEQLEDSFNSTIKKTVDTSLYIYTLKEKKDQLKEYRVTTKKKKDELIYLEFCQELLKDDGIKTLIIKEYLPLINKWVNHYLSEMGMTIGFQFDEFFNEEICSLNKELFSYESFSDGQKLKIDLALLFTWREISCIKNSLKMNLLFLDEIFDSSLDLQNTELAIQTLESFSQHANVFIISHKTELFSSVVDKIYSCSLINNFTLLTESE